MRCSKLFFRTLKEAPAEADVISHQLLERGGYLKKLGKGLYIYTPLMWKVLKKTMEVIREELDRSGCQEISMPLLHPSELWHQTGRWEDFTSAHLLYTLKDREDHNYCLAPTHEEIVTYLVANWITSHKQLPINLYQIGTKFRDEIRPRFGLIRGKEFIMKDGYSFSTSPEEMDGQYELMRQAYSRIFQRLNLDFVIVAAHGGKIGKGKSEEFQVRAEIGEDAVLTCGSYAANSEAAVAIASSFPYDTSQKPIKEVSTPNVKTIEELKKFLSIAPQLILKTIVYKLIFAQEEKFVAICIRGDRQVNDVKVATHFGALEIALASDDEIEKMAGTKSGFIGPLHSKLPYYPDKTCLPMTNFICAGNKPDIHFVNVNWGRDCKLPEAFDFLLAEDGDGCPHIPGGTYKLQRGIEVGHIFNLGTRYTEALGANFQDAEGKTFPIWMGTYGIGVGRVVSACIEQHHDAKGMIWPLSITPFKFMVTAAVMNKPEQVRAAENLYHVLLRDSLDPLLDDRHERLGFKLKDSDLIGLPFKLIIGKMYEEEQKVEIESRNGEKELVSVENILDWARAAVTKRT